MCGRFQLSVKGKEISERFNVEVFNEKYSPNYNCTPSQFLPVITNNNPEVLSFYQWGIVPPWSNKSTRVINIRSETIQQKFKKAFEQQRCLIPANGFYEWRKSDKVPFRIFLKNETLFSMAGIWASWKGTNNKIIHTFSIITTHANHKMSKIHHRMPVILSKETEKAWLTGKNTQLLIKLLKPLCDNKTELYPISKKINSPQNNSSELIKKQVNENEQMKLF